MNHEMHQYFVRGLALHEESRVPFLILENRSENDTITFQVAASEADTLLLHMSGAGSPVPNPQDTIAKLFNRHFLRPSYLEIHHLSSAEAKAELHYRSLLRQHSMSLLPAEGIALAIRLDVPIFLTPEAIITGTVANPLYEYSHEPSQSFLFVGSEIFD